MSFPGRVLVTVILAAATGAAAAPLPRYDHVVVVIEENHSFAEILGRDSPAPYLRYLADNGAVLAESFAIGHPSEPNYLALFSGSTHGVTDDSVPAGTPFTTPNLGAELLAKGFTFAGFSQSQPQLGYNGKAFTTVPGRHQYERKHNPWVNWQSVTPGPDQLPPSVNLPFEKTFPTRPDADFAVLPTVAFVVPDERFDMHDGSIAAGDEWLHENLAAYATWARDHNSLLIVTFDEDDGSQGNRIPTFFYGAHLRPGRYRERTDHYGMLRTLEELYGLDHAGASAAATPITDVFAGSATTPDGSTSAAAGLAGKWTAEFDSRIGVQKYVFEFKHAGGQLTGQATHEHQYGKGTVPLKDIKVDGDKVSFSEAFSRNGNEITIAYSGTIAGDEMQLTRKVGDLATQQITAKRAPPEK